MTTPSPSDLAPRPVARLPLRIRLAWGAGGIADNFMVNTLFVLGMILYVTAFDMPAGLAGLALAIPRFVDALANPLVGHLSDNLRTRWGRRRPLIAIGAVGAAVLLPMLWFPPMLHTVQNPWYANGPFWYLAVLGSLYFIFYSMFVVSYAALGFELTDDYDQRTRVLAWRMYLGLGASMLVPALYWFCRLEVFGEGVPGEIRGVRWVTLGIGAVVLLTGLLPALVCRERPEASRPPRKPMLLAIRETLANPPFRILFVAYVAVVLGLNTALGVAAFVHIYYVFQDSVSVDAAKDHAALLGLVAGVLGALASYGSMFLAAAISRRTGKRPALILGLAMMLLGAIAAFFLFDPSIALNRADGPIARGLAGVGGLLGFAADPVTLKPGVLIATVIFFVGSQGCWLMIDSMTADICDEDELRTGQRREGMFSAAQGFGRKLALGFTVLFGGYLLEAIGFDPNAAEQAGGVAPRIADRMLWLYVLCQAGGLLLAMAIFSFYPISRQRAEATRAELERRRGVAELASMR